MEALQSSLSTLSELFHERMAGFEAELPKSQVTPSTASLSSDYALFKSFILETLNNIQHQLDLLAHSVDTLEMRGRRKMLLLHGIPEAKNEDLPQVVAKSFKEYLQLPDFTTADIRRCHRMGRSSSGTKSRPIVIKFQSVTIRDGTWYSKAKFKGSGVTVSEFLTKQRHETFMAARQKFGVSQCWTKEGYIHLVTSDGARHRITRLSELHKINEQDADKTTTLIKPPTKSKRSQRK